ncbi:uncharacterized protein B0P05DRAFT_475891, partial [Gilbertella persicaria]|uniref:uncharacterized protein n=1 Tax=Gilbertella persicaria TaxID=101096 RepID=UPI00221F5AB0
SKFSSPNAYTLCRFSDPITKSHTYHHPFSVFALADYDRGNNPGAYLFHGIGILVLKHGESAHLPWKNIEKWASLNDALNKYLSSLADLLMPSIVAANESVAIQIAQAFDFMVRASLIFCVRIFPHH